MTVREVAVRKQRQWRQSFNTWVYDNFKYALDPWQAEAGDALSDPRTERLALKACKGPGKTFFLALAVLWFLSTRPHPKIACTSITGDNLASGLWPEIGLHLHRSAWLREVFLWTKTAVVCREEPSNWFAVARTWPKTADPAAQADCLAGIHADYVLFVLDEVGGIPQAVMTTAEAVLATGIETKLLIAGNPSRTDGPLYRVCTTDRALWRVIEITGDPDSQRRAPRVKLAWARDQIAQYGRSNPWVMVNVLGEFPPASINALLGPDDVQAAMKRHLPESAYNWAQKRLGVDVARFGDDRTVLFPRQGLAAFRPRVMRHARGSAASVDIATAVMIAKQQWGSEVELFDGTGGWSAGAIDVLMSNGYTPLDVQFHAPALDPRFANRRAEMHWALAEWVKRGGALPEEPELLAELTTMTYTFTGGRFLMEPKDHVKARLGRSPDLADALALTFGVPDQPAEIARGLERRRGAGKVLTDFDPYEGYR